MLNEMAGPKSNPKTKWLAEKKEAVADNLLREAADYFAAEKSLTKVTVTKEIVVQRIDEIELSCGSICRFHESDRWMKILVLPQGLQAFCYNMDQYLGVRCDTVACLCY